MTQSNVPPIMPGGPGYAAPGATGPVKQTNVLAIVSLICGLLGCVPVVTSLVAIITGFLGIKKANDPQVNGGKGLAIAGLLLGVLGLLIWAGVGYAAKKGADVVMAVPTAGKAFMTDVASGNVAAAQAKASGMSAEQVQALVDQAKPWGAFKDSTGAPTWKNENGRKRAAYMGVAEFANASRGFALGFVDDGQGLKVNEAYFADDASVPTTAPAGASD